jgi:hypothetical protein
MIVKFECFLDDAKREQWPVLNIVPNIGDYVESESGMILQVKSITWSQAKVRKYSDGNRGVLRSEDLEPMAIITLSVRDGGSIKSFMENERDRQKRASWKTIY